MHCNRKYATTLLIAAVFLFVTITGCDSGPAAGEVRGKVTFKGQPVKEGMVTFLNTTEGGAFEGQIKSDGTYAVPNPVAVGEYVVEIKPPVVIQDTDPGKSPPAPVEKPMKDIPKKYRMQGTTPLKASVKAGPNELNFDMTP
jgi:hypothetical protein